jgi:hypothetical protein
MYNEVISQLIRQNGTEVYSFIILREISDIYLVTSMLPPESAKHERLQYKSRFKGIG